MAAKKEYQIIINAVGKGIRATTTNLSQGLDRGKKAMTAFNAAARRGRQVSDRLTGSIKGLVGAYAGWQGVTNAVRIIKDADQATFNLSSSVKAANREFENTGTVNEWQSSIDRLSKRLQIYSDTALKNAVSRTVDMTKRLGMEKDQMEELIVRAGDLGAGKVELEEAIERVAAAMRGESESAEYLGLTLNENYVKAWYEANEATETAWQNLNDAEKAQVRYQVFLEQTNEMQGRAAESAKTLGGAWQLVKKEVINAVSENKDAVSAMNDIAHSLRDNAGEIGQIIAQLVSLAARAIEFTVKWREVIAVLLGTAAAITVFSKLVAVIKGLNAAFAVLTGSGIISFFGSLRASILAATATAGAAQAAFFSLFGVVVLFAGMAVTKAITAFIEMRDAQKQAAAAARQASDTIDRVKSKYESFADVRVPDNIMGRSTEELAELNERLYKARAYYRALLLDLEEKAGEKTFFGTYTEEARQAREKMGDVKDRLRELKSAIIEIENADGFKQSTRDIGASKEALEKFKKTAQEAYAAAEKDAEKYGKKIKQLNQEIADREISLQDKIRELRRQNMSEEQAAADLRLQAIEKERSAREALARFQQSGEKSDLEQARRFADESEDAWTGYANEGKEATEEAIRGLKRVNDILDEADKTQIDTFAQMKADAEDAMTRITDMIDHINESKEINVPVRLRDLEKARDQINSLVRDETKHIRIKVSEERAAGGRVGMAKGGRFPGDSKKDSIPVLARPGEGFVRNEALKVWDSRFGRGFFEAINAPWSAAGKSLIQALSGRIQMPNLAPSRPAPTRAFAAGGRVSGPGEVMTINFRAGNTEMPLSVLGRSADLRDQVRAFDAELRKMGLSRG